MKVYFISGLGADKTIFKYIQLPSAFEPVYLNWIPPFKKETLSSYALRLAKDIDSSQPFSIIGLSMGGMLATEISAHLKPVHTILISSISSSASLPWYYRFLGALGLHKIIPLSLLRRAGILYRLFSAQRVADKRMLMTMVHSMDLSFIHWAFGAILKWENNKYPGNLYHIHGTNDKILPLRFTKPTHIIPHGGHLMVVNRANEINTMLQKILSG